MDTDQQQEEEKEGKQPRSNEKSQEESSKEEEEEKKKKGERFGGNLDININIQRDKKNLGGANNRTISRNEEMVNVLDGRETLIHPQPRVSLTSEQDSTYMNLQAIVNLDEDDFNFTFDPEEILSELNGSQDKPGEGPVSVEMDPVPLLGSASGSRQHGQPTPNPQFQSHSDIGEGLLQDERESTKPVSCTLPINQGQGILKVRLRKPQLEPPWLHSPNTRRFKWLHKPGRFLRIPFGITQQQLNRPGSFPPDLHHTISTEDFEKSEEDRKDEANNKQKK